MAKVKTIKVSGCDFLEVDGTYELYKTSHDFKKMWFQHKSYVQIQLCVYPAHGIYHIEREKFPTAYTLTKHNGFANVYCGVYLVLTNDCCIVFGLRDSH